MKLRKKSKILAAAIAMMTLSTAAAVTGTVAWFSANNLVSISGMAVQTKVSSNLLVSEDTTEANFKESLTQTREAYLEPASTIDGNNFFYHSTKNVAADGSDTDAEFISYSEAAIDNGDNPATTAVENDWSNSINDTNAGKTRYDSKFNANYNFNSPAVGSVAYAYIDYNFYLKATSSENDQKISMSKCNLLYNAGAVSDKAWRVAIFATAGQANAAAASTADLGSVKSILTLASAENQTAGKAVSSTSGLGDVTYNSAATIESDIDSTVTRYYKVLVRLYLEGEDKTCNNETYAVLTNAYSLDIEFSLNSSTGVTAISSTPAI